MADRWHSHRVRIYYEDTDISGLVYHANYLKYFERAREHLLGPETLVRLLRDDGLGFVVYRAEMTFKRGATLGDEIEIRTTYEVSSPFRATFCQRVYSGDGQTSMIDGVVEMVCVDRGGKACPLPAFLVELSR